MRQPRYPAAHIVLVDDEPQILLSFGVALRTAGLTNIMPLDDSRKLFPLLGQQEASVVVLDLSMPHFSGFTLLGEITRSFPQIPVIIVTATDHLDTAVQCMKAGAFDYLVKPVDMDKFLSTVKKALEISDLRSEISSLSHYLLTNQLKHEPVFADLVTRSPRMRAIFQYVEAIASSRQTVLITGETGVGKELISRAIHDLSGCRGPFVSVNIAGLDDSVFSDTLFGHKKGAYTGADHAREGLIAQADEGTLFLDEIGDLGEASQVKLLRLLQEHRYLPLGSDITRQSTARIVVATNHDIPALIKKGTFRGDLYYRLRTHQAHVPPLRERREDIPLLLNHFITGAALSLKKSRPAYPQELITLLSTYHFPGNVRELQSMVMDAVAQHHKGMLSLDSFRKIIREENAGAPASPPPLLSPELLSGLAGRFPTLKEAESYLISEALKMSNNNQGIAASMLGVTRQALNKRLTRNRG